MGRRSVAKVKYDAVVQAVHYTPDGQVDWVRTFQRRGPIFSDYVVLTREALVEELKAGKKYKVGERKAQMGGTFEVSESLRLIQDGDNEILVTGETKSERDRLDGVPII